jgi:hypothetical protein
MHALARIAALPLLLVLFATGCQGQSEGERCTPGNDDCAANLVCFPVTMASVPFGVCCSSASTIALCNPSASTFDAGAGSDASDAGAAEASEAGETGTDAAEDASDAATE